MVGQSSPRRRRLAQQQRRKRFGRGFLVIVAVALYLVSLVILHNHLDDPSDLVHRNEKAWFEFQEKANYVNKKANDRLGLKEKTKNDNDKKDSPALARTTPIDRPIEVREKLRFKLEQSPENKNSPLWELSDVSPQWMKDYFRWHQKTRKTLTQEIWKHLKEDDTHVKNATSTKFLVVQCLPNNDGSSCGTLLERLGLLPYYLKIADETNRILLIHWTVPADLSEYLMPPMGGCDWRSPKWMQQLLLDDQQGVLVRNETQILWNSSYFQNFDSEFLLRVQLKYSLDFEKNYDALRPNITLPDKRIVQDEASFRQVFHELWAIFFVPTATIRKNVVNTLRSNRGMEIGQYTSIELTELKTVEKDGGEAEDISRAKRVFGYIWKLLHNEPIMVISNATNVTLALTELNDTTAKEKDKQVFARYKTLSRWARDQGKMDPRELFSQNLMDFGAANVTTDTPEIFRDLFVNLYVMAMGRCVVSYQDEEKTPTFGRLASLIGYDSKCYCQLWRSKTNTIFISGDTSFLDYVWQPEIKFTRDPPKLDKYFRIPMIKDGADEMNLKGDVSRNLLSEEGSKFPEWMENYLDWHRETKSQLDPSNWKDTKYLILGCFEGYKSCGGISDRLKPLPLLAWEAHQSKRILLIWWEKPKPLEEWLVPPSHADGGVDWTIPSFLKEEILRDYPMIRKNNGLRTLTGWRQRETFRKGNMGQRVVVYNVQSPLAGEDHYTEDQILHSNQFSKIGNTTVSHSPKIGNSYQDVFHHLFRRLFRPSPRLEKILEFKMKAHNLVPGEYTSVHLRALYGDRDHREHTHAIELAALGVNCASNLFPGAPVFFASDMSFAVDAAHAYGKLHGLPVVSLDFEDESNPIHLDKDPNWKNRSAKEYDSTFIDLYFLAESRCVAYSNGGYGLFGSLLSHEPDCKMRFFQGKKKIKECVWMNDKFERQNLKLPSVADVVAGGRVG